MELYGQKYGQSSNWDKNLQYKHMHKEQKPVKLSHIDSKSAS